MKGNANAGCIEGSVVVWCRTAISNATNGRLHRTLVYMLLIDIQEFCRMFVAARKAFTFSSRTRFTWRVALLSFQSPIHFIPGEP
jgi:hypothetical protein